MHKILIIEDNDTIKILLSSVLSHEQLVFFSTLKEAEKFLETDSCDLILLDIELPDGDGLNFLTKLNLSPELNHIPVIIVSGKSEITNKVMAFSFGAEDFISKPFDVIELKARVESKLKKAKLAKSQTEHLKVGDLIINTAKQKVWYNHSESSQNQIDLTSLEFKLLMTFAKRIDHVFSREVLLNEVWGNDTYVTDRSVDTHVAHLRKKLQPSSTKIETVIGSGYRFVTNK